MGPEQHVEGIPDYEREGYKEPQEGVRVWGVRPSTLACALGWGAGEGFGGGEVGGWELGFVGAGGHHVATAG